MLFTKTNAEILLELDGYVYGHTQAKKALINAVNRSKIRYHQKYNRLLHEEYLMKPSKVLLLGGSGTGKSFLVHSLSKVVDFPYICVDATRLGPSGGTGLSPRQLEKQITAEAERLLNKRPQRYFGVEGTIDQMVVFVDEIDKLGASYDSSGNWNTHVQSSFLTLFENYDTLGGITWVFAGAFTSLLREKTHKPSLGFNLISEDTTSHLISDEDIVKAGLIPELVGRLTCISPLDSFTKSEYNTILHQYILPKKRIDMSYFGIIDEYIAEEALDKMIDKAYKSGQGVRALIREVDNYYLDAEFSYEDFKYLQDESSE